jgi:hypothetical protein
MAAEVSVAKLVVNICQMLPSTNRDRSKRVSLTMKRRHKVAYSLTSLVSVSLISNLIAPQSAIVAAPPRNPDKTVNCEVLVVDFQA